MKIKRVYDPAEETDGCRILVDRLWPRGISREKAQIDFWLKSVAPSNELRKWFGHDVQRFPEFAERFRAELAESGALEELRTLLREHPAATLLFAARDEEHNNAVVLQSLLETGQAYSPQDGVRASRLPGKA